MSFFIGDSVIDSRDIIERIEELASEAQDAYEVYVDEYKQEEYDAYVEAFPQGIDEVPADKDDWLIENGFEPLGVDDWLDTQEDYLELEQLKALQEEAATYVSDWRYGATFILEDHFKDYTMEMLEDCGYIPKDFPSWIEVDWDATANNVKVDYTEFTLGDYTYLAR